MKTLLSINFFQRFFRTAIALAVALCTLGTFIFAANNPPGDPPPPKPDPAESDVAVPDITPPGQDGDGEEDPCSGGPEVECISYSLSFGKNAFSPLSGGQIKLQKMKPTPDLYDYSALYYTGAAGSWIWSDDLSEGKRVFSFVYGDGLFVTYSFDAGASIGYPTGKNSKRLVRAYLLDVNGNTVSNTENNNAVYLELRYTDTSRRRYSLASKEIVAIGNSKGQVINLSDVPSAFKLDVVRNDMALRQIKGPEGLADIDNLPSGNGFSIKLYAPAQVGLKINGFHTVTGNPFRTITFVNPDVGNPNPQRMKITDTWDNQTRDYMFTYLPALDDWQLDRGNGASTESKELLSGPDANPKVWQRLLRDSSGNIVSKVRTTLFQGDRGDVFQTSKTIDPDGLDYTTISTYDLDNDSPDYGKLLSRIKPNGFWVRYQYDAQGRLAKKITPWLDSPSGSPESSARVKAYQYVSHDPMDSVAINDARPRTIIERITGIETRRTYYVYGKNATTNESYEIEERAASQGAAYGASGNLRTLKNYYPATSGLASAGRLKTIQNPNNTLTTYLYTLTPTQLLTTETQGTVASPAGIANKSIRRQIAQNAMGTRASEQTQVYTGTAYSPLNTTEITYNAYGLPVQVSKDGRTVFSATYTANLQTSNTDEFGIKKIFTYDALERLVTETKEGYGAQLDIVTTYDRTLGGLDCGCDASLQVTVAAGGLSLTSSIQKNQAGQITQEITQAGLVTNYAYANGGRTISIAHPNTAVETQETYLDGQPKSLLGNNLTPQFQTYDVNSDGSIWKKTTEVTPTGARWTRTTSDFLDRLKKTEKPGFGQDVVIVAESTYDSVGFLVTQVIQAIGGTTLPAKGTETTTYVYDALGHLISQTTVNAGQATPAVTNISEKFYQQENGTWFFVTQASQQYTESGQTTTTTTSIKREQLNNFSGGIVAYSEIYAPSSAVGTAFDLTHFGQNKITQTLMLDRPNKTIVQSTFLPTSIQPDVETMENGLLLSKISSSNGGTTLFSYDPLGRRIGEKQPRHSAYSSITYNAQGQISTQADAVGNITTYTYYGNGSTGAGQLYSETNALGHVTYHNYNLRGQETHTWGSATYPTRQEYDIYGQRIALTTFRDTTANFNAPSFPIGVTGDITIWTYDAATGILLNKTYADGKGPSYDYYADGLLKTRTWARKDANNNPLTTTYTYTAQGWLSQIDYSDTTPDVAYTYNAFGKPLTVTDGAGARVFTYDLATQSLLSEAYSGILTGTLQRSYDAFNRPTGYVLLDDVPQVSKPALTAATYTYDPLGNLNQVQGDTIPSTIDATNITTITLTPTTFTYNRLLNSNLISTVVGPVHTVTNTYETNRDYLVTKENRIATGPNANTVASHYTYTVNTIGKYLTRAQSGTAFSTPSTDFFGYNPRGEVTVSTNSLLPASNRSYSYDPIGNRLAATEGAAPSAITKDYTSNQLNQYTQIQTITSLSPITVIFTYDDDGNLLTDGTGKIYTWDCENRLIQVNLTNGDVIKYNYDSNSRRVKREYVAVQSTAVEVYLYDGWNVIDETKTLANAQGPEVLSRKSHVWGLDISDSLEVAGGIGGLLAENSSAGINFFTFDGNGNLSETIALNGAIISHSTYDVFGQEEKTFAPSGDGMWGFSTKKRDPLTFKNYFGRRFYDPFTGRWLSRDPFWNIGENGEKKLLRENEYGFLYNSPLNSVDPIGEFCITKKWKWMGKYCCLDFNAEFGFGNRPGWGVSIGVKCDGCPNAWSE